jgi:hypothetical protein
MQKRRERIEKVNKQLMYGAVYRRIPAFLVIL